MREKGLSPKGVGEDVTLDPGLTAHREILLGSGHDCYFDLG